MWELLSNARVTKAQRKLYNQDEDDTCLMCGQEVEDLGHLVVHCEFAKKIWRRCPNVTYPRNFTFWPILYPCNIVSDTRIRIRASYSKPTLPSFITSFTTLTLMGPPFGSLLCTNFFMIIKQGRCR